MCVDNPSNDDSCTTTTFQVHKLQKILLSFKCWSIFNYELCQLEKHIHCSFLDSLHKWASSFSFVYFDIQGPSCIATPYDFKYFVIFIDYYCRCTWICLMNNHPKVFSIFNEIKAQFGVLIRDLHGDNVHEYMSNQFQPLLAFNDIFIKLWVVILLNKME